MPTLYQMTAEAMAINAALNREREDDKAGAVDDLVAEMFAVRDGLDRKIEAMAVVARENLATAEFMSVEIKRLVGERDHATATHARLKGIISDTMAILGIKSISTPLFPCIRRQNNGGNTPLTFFADFDVNALPDDLKRVSVSPDADAIRAALTDGQSVTGVALGERGTHLRGIDK